MVGILIAVFLGWAGGYRFYKNNPKWGLIYLLTLGLCGFGWIYDIVLAIYTYWQEDVRHSFPENTTSSEITIRNTNSSPTPNVPLKEATFFIHSSKDSDKNIKQLHEKFIVFDTETTGLNSNSDRIISIAAILFVNGIEEKRFYSLVNPGRSIPPEATDVNGITNEMVANAPNELTVIQQFIDFIGDAITGKTLLVAYNSIFDAKFLKAAAERYNIKGNIRHFDVLAYAKKKLPVLKNYKQVTVATHFRINTDNAHNSMRDSEMCAEILLKLLDY